MPPRIRPSQVREVPQPNRPGSKGRPTPKRKVAEAARRRPIVQDKRTNKKADRAKAREFREKERQALLTNDERNYPYRDQGPVRRWARDYVDSRRTWREYMLPVAVVMMVLTFTVTFNPYIYVAVTILLYVLMIYAFVSSWLYARKVNRLAVERFGAAKVPDRIGFYAVMRAFQSRRSRLPRPEVERGEEPR